MYKFLIFSSLLGTILNHIFALGNCCLNVTNIAQQKFLFVKSKIYDVTQNRLTKCLFTVVFRKNLARKKILYPVQKHIIIYNMLKTI